jgi:N-acetylmuramoyl-L-alanine amidase
MPAVLTENFFMDNLEEFQNILNTKTGRQKIINFHVNAIIRTKIEIFNEVLPNNFNPNTLLT